jgi:zinc transporter
MEKSELIYGYYFNDGKQTEKISSLEMLDTSRPYWLHFNYTLETTKNWLEQHSLINPVVINALLNEETRPRATAIDDGILISLRGVNLAPTSNPEDMVSIRLWLTKDKVISTRNRTLLSVQNIADEMENGSGPQTSSELVTSLTDKLISRISDTVNEIEDKVSEIEDNILTSSNYNLRNELSDIRRQIISLRRYLSPQKEAMIQMLSQNIKCFSIEEKIQLRETMDHLTRYIEDLDSIKDRAAVSQEELNNNLAEQMNNRMYVLSIVAAIFLPLGFLTGLWGVNVGGIPGTDSSNGFSLFMLLLVCVVTIQVWFFRKKKWF